MPIDTDGPAAPASMLHCSSCGSRLTHDQRYCLDCGARRGSLPAHIAELIAAIREQGRSAANPEFESLVEPRAVPEQAQPFAFRLPGARAAAVAVMGMLAFGVITGSLVGGGVESLVSAPLLLAVAPHTAATAGQSLAPAATAISAGAAAGGGGSGSASAAGASSGAGAGAGAAGSASAATSPAAAATATSPSGADTTGGTAGSPSGAPPVKHVFLIVLSDHGFEQAFAPGSHSGYLSGALRRQGELVQNYYAVAAAPLANEIALISGQGPTPQTDTDCAQFTRITPAAGGAHGQVLGSGCVYPARTRTVADQLTKAGDRWKAYVQGAGTRTACRYPKPGRGEQPPRPGQQYLTWRNPFVYFRSLTRTRACATHEADLGQLASDLQTESKTPSLAYIIPGACDDGSDRPCRPNAPAGLGAADRFLTTVVPEIERSAAYKAGGLIAITFANAPQTGPRADPSGCCNTPAYPNVPPALGGSAATPAGTTATTTSATTPADTTATATTTTALSTGTATSTSTTATTTTTPPTTTTATTTTATTTTPTTTSTTTTSTTSTSTSTTTTTPTTTTSLPPSLGEGETTPTGGGGQVGLLLISPYVQPNSTDVVDYFNHFSLLASIEDLFGLGHLGYAANSQLPVFGPGVYNAYSSGM